MSDDSKVHIDQVISSRIRPIFDRAAQRIDALKPGEKIPATELAKELAKEFGGTGPVLYPVLKLMLDDYPGVSIRKGAHGGIVKNTVAVVVTTPATAIDLTKDDAESSAD